MDRCGLFFCYFILFCNVINEEVKGLELILSVSFAFGNCCSELTSCQRISLYKWNTIVRLQKQNQSIRERAGTFGVTKSTVWYILRKEERTGELNNITNLDVSKYNSGGWSENPLHGKENPFTTSSQEKNTLQEADVSLSSLQSREELSRRQTCHYQVYNQEKTSPEQIQRLHHKLKGQIRPKTSKKARALLEKHLWTAKLRSTSTRMMYGEGLEQLMI